MRIKRIFLVVFFGILSAVLLAAETVSAAPITINGLTFTEVSANVQITSGSGTGSVADPIVLHENVSGLDVTMSIEGLIGFGNLTQSGHAAGFALQKVVTNLTSAAWNFYDHELQETLGVPSGEGDGLSFAQGCASCRPFTSNMFTIVDEIIDVRDYVNFSGGIVNPGETVTFNIMITDNTPLDIFYLRQRPDFEPGVKVPEPGSLLLLGSGLGGLWLRGRKRFKANS